MTTNQRQALVRADSISRSFGPIQALVNVSVELRAGTVHAVVGHNGAGKSTLMNVMSGVVEPDSGRILIEGEATRFRDPHEAALRGVAMVHQELSILSDLSVAENLSVGFEPMAGFGIIRRGQMHERAERLLADLGLEVPVRTLCADLPVGDRQLIEIARAMSMDARIIILDEPTSALTIPEQEQLFEFIRQLTERGIGILYVSHRLAEVMEIADVITVLRDGQVVADRVASEIDQAELIELMVGHRVESEGPGSARETAEEQVLEVDGVAAFDGRLHDISFSAGKGEIVGIVGILGSGRTELFGVLFGVAPLEKGVIRLEGNEIRPSSPIDAINAGIGLVPEDRRRQGILPGLSIWKNIDIASIHDLFRNRFGLVREGEARSATQEEVERLSIATPSVDVEVQNLSGGNQQKVVLGRWLTREPRLLLMDDPTAGIDVGSKSEIYGIVRSLAEAGTTVIVSSSEFAELLELCHRILIMRDGTIVGEVDPAGTTEAYLVHLATGAEAA